MDYGISLKLQMTGYALAVEAFKELVDYGRYSVMNFLMTRSGFLIFLPQEVYTER